MSKIDVGVVMKNKITETLEGSLYPWSERDTNYFAQEILDLLKEEGWLSPEEIAKEKMGNTLVINEYLDEEYRKKDWKSPDDTPTCYEKGCVSWGAQGNEKDLRAKGWLHKDDPMKGLRVERECEHKNYNCTYDCKLKLDTCIEKERPLTVGEALDIFVQVIGSNYLLTDLVTKDGGKIVKEEK